MPAIAMLWGKQDSRHTFGVSAFGISGFGVTFPESNTNPINFPQSMGGFGRVESNYQLMQVGLTYAYEISEKVSVGIAPTINYAMLELEPNPLSAPSMELGYPKSNNASAFGIGAQFGIYYNSGKGIKLGASYKSQQFFNEFDFENTYLSGTAAPSNSFTMNFPSILSAGIGYSKNDFDLALDYRFVDYKNTEGFEEKGWNQNASVKGFGWESISVISAGIQYKGIEKLPLRLGYTYSSNPITSDLAFFSVPATAIIQNGIQIGFSYQINPKISIDAVYHHGMSNGSTEGPLLSPMMASPSNPYGTVPGSKVSYRMTTDLIMAGVNFKL
jgi:long-chain fatty acid transport protein